MKPHQVSPPFLKGGRGDFHGKKSEKDSFRHSGESRIRSGAGAGIQCLQLVTNSLDPGDPVPAKAGNRGDDFLQSHHL